MTFKRFGLPWWLRWKGICLQCRRPRFISLVGKIPWKRKWQPTPVLLPGNSHGWRTLVGCSPWGHKESDMTERLHFHFSLSYIGEGNGNPLQCSCLENPRDGGAWWAAVCGVTQSRTRLKRLSSSSSVYASMLLSPFISPCPSSPPSLSISLFSLYLLPCT